MILDKSFPFFEVSFSHGLIIVESENFEGVKGADELERTHLRSALYAVSHIKQK